METEAKSQFVIAIQNPERFTILPDGWIRDSFINREWGPSSKKRMEYQQAKEYCEKLGGCLPEVQELHSLVDFRKDEPACFEVFEDTEQSYYWSATKTAWNEDAAWCVGFYRGCVFFSYLGGDYYVRPVRPCQG